MPETAPAALQAQIARSLKSRGVARRDVSKKVTPTLQPPRRNKFLPRGADRWVAACPECPGAEVVPETGLFLCGSCGVQAPVDRSSMHRRDR